MIIGNVKTYQKTDLVIPNVICPCCGHTVDTALVRLVQKAVILFIPVAKKTLFYFTLCPHCKQEYILGKKLYKQVLNAENKQQTWNTACKTSIENRLKKLKARTERSDKNIGIAALLALFFGLFGLQNIYMGHIKRFFISTAFLLLGIACVLLAFLPGVNVDLITFIPAAFLATNVYWGLIDFFRIIFSCAKDSKGRYIMTKNRFKTYVTTYNASYNVYTQSKQSDSSDMHIG